MIKREEETRRRGRSNDDDFALRRFNEEIRTRGTARACVVFNDLCCDFSPKIAILLCHHKISVIDQLFSFFNHHPPIKFVYFVRSSEAC